MNNTWRVAIGALLLPFAPPICPQRVSVDASVRTSDKAYIQATGEATISAKPDQATIDIGVVTPGTTAIAVAALNAKQTDAVLADLRRLVTTSDQLKTSSYSLRPNYQYPKPGAPPTITGYTATNIVEVVLSDVSLAARVIDSVVQSGANQVQKVQFGLKNPQAARSQALREAGAQAKANAEAIAAGLGVKIMRVLSAEEYEPVEEFGAMKKSPPPPAAGAVVATQLETGAIEVTAAVTLRVEVGQ